MKWQEQIGNHDGVLRCEESETCVCRDDRCVISSSGVSKEDCSKICGGHGVHASRHDGEL